jgi:hypothetical protein
MKGGCPAHPEGNRNVPPATEPGSMSQVQRETPIYNGVIFAANDQSARFQVARCEGLQPPLRVRSAFRSRLRALGRPAVPPGRYVVGAAPTVSARSRATAAPSFAEPLRQPGPASQRHG